MFVFVLITNTSHLTPDTGGDKLSLNWDLNQGPLEYHASTSIPELWRPDILPDFHRLKNPVTACHNSPHSILYIYMHIADS